MLMGVVNVDGCDLVNVYVWFFNVDECGCFNIDVHVLLTTVFHYSP